ncbi:InlB B-repeat-containing protein [Salinibacterium sp. SWN248]|uniref:InlB B-repeat-containing protein n=1 Tax=Salinibacterium sp. SWN248 TaxID=2792056 RepID=UPI0018CC9FAA|nr:InlB B-repeat-containing protein [Salinibacterium sp. SWN248]MBH0024481.1 InlB B-repeat-containing protein [Salinibacterium sp. SWN248]
MIPRPKILPSITAVAVALALTFAGALPANAATYAVYAWGGMPDAFAYASDGGTVILVADVVAPAGRSIAVKPGESITLDLNGFDLTINSDVPDSLAAIEVPSTSTLTIVSSGGGTLTVTGGLHGAGIGGNDGNDGGSVIVNSGTILATGSAGGAGIGGGNNGTGGTTTIKSGTTTATGSAGGAGIGGGNNGTGGSTTITGGTITATGGQNGGAGIGGGGDSNGGTTTITGGSITATGGQDGGAGIGGGYDAGAPGTLDVRGTPNAGAALDGGGSSASPIVNTVTPAGVGYSAATSLIGNGGNIIIGFNYLVTFDADGGTSTPAEAITDGSTITAPTDPTRDGYTFTGWTANGSTYNFTTPVTKPITLTATWTEVAAVTHLVTFDADGGTSTPAETITDGSTIAAPTDPTRDGYTFTAWTANGSTYNFTTPVTEPITLTATWAEVAVVTEEPATTGELAATGIDLMPSLGATALLLLMGIALVAFHRRGNAPQR